MTHTRISKAARRGPDGKDLLEANVRRAARNRGSTFATTRDVDGSGIGSDVIAFDFDDAAPQSANIAFDGAASQLANFAFDAAASQSANIAFDGAASQLANFAFDDAASQSANFAFDDAASRSAAIAM